MADPAQIDIIADRRVPFDDPFTFLEEDWTSSTLRLQIRLTRDTTGTPLLDLTSPTDIGVGYAGTDTVANHITAGRLTSEIHGVTNPATGQPYADSDSVLLTVMILFVDASSFPLPEQVGDDLTAYYDIIREPASGANVMVMRGKFTVRAGVTIP